MVDAEGTRYKIACRGHLAAGREGLTTCERCLALCVGKGCRQPRGGVP
jgi:hypothetical protein